MIDADYSHLKDHIMIKEYCPIKARSSRAKWVRSARSSILPGLAICATLLLISACSSPKWQSLETLEEQTPEENNLALLAHVYQYQSIGKNGTVSFIKQFADSTAENRVSEDETLNHYCLSAFVEGYSDNKFERNSRDNFRCVMKGALAWHTERHGKMASKTPLDIMIYFNGGLNDKNAVLKTAFASYQHIKFGSYQQKKEDSYYPIFMPWPTGVFDTYKDDVAHVRAGRYSSVSWPPSVPELPLLASIPLRPIYDLLLGLAATPSAWSTSSIEVARTTFARESSGFNVLADDHLLPHWNDKKGKLIIEADNNLIFAKGVDDDARIGLLSRTVDNATYLGLFPVRLVTTPAIGPGFALWRNMVRRSRTAFRHRDEFPKEDDVAIKSVPPAACENGYEENVHARQACHPRGSGAFGQFFHWLSACRVGASDCPLTPKEQANLKELRLTLIGHSMGTIVINEAVNAFPDLPYQDIVYMAGAATVRATSETLSPVLEKNQGCTRFFNLMLHPLNDSLERTAKGALLSGSLLSYIDEYLEHPKTLPDRTIGQWRNLRQTRHLFPEEARRWSLYRVFDHQAEPVDDGRKALKWNPIKHGSFNDENMPFWRESFWKPDHVSFDQQPSPEACGQVFAQKAGR